MAVVAKRRTDREEAPGAALSGRVWYEIDPDHTRLGFAAGYMGVATVRGEFRSFTGYVELDPQEPSTAECRIAVDTISLDTGVVDRDNDLLSVSFLDSDHFRHIGYLAHGVRPLEGDDYGLEGWLTMHGRRRRLDLLPHFRGRVIDDLGVERPAFRVMGQLDRRDYGMTWDARLRSGARRVSDTVALELDVTLLRRGGREPFDDHPSTGC